MMLADAAQTFATVLIVFAAAGYLGVVLRRSWRQRGGGCCGTSACHPESPAESRLGKATPIVTSDELTAAARRRHAERQAAGNGPPAS